MTHSNIVVVGHEGQQDALSHAHQGQEEYLSCATPKGDGTFSLQEVGCHLGDGDQGEDNIKQRELAEQKVHGCVEPGVQADQEKQNGVAQEAHGKRGSHQRGEQLM